MSLLVVGTIAFDEIETPSGRVRDETGGSATYFALAASRFTRVRIVGAIGADFPRERFSVFDGRDVDLAGVETVPGGKTFRWSGRYQGDMNAAETLETQLNVLASFDPKRPPGYETSPFVFLANTAPAVQMKVIDATEAASRGGRRFIVADTMNHWIEHARDGLLEVLRRV